MGSDSLDLVVLGVAQRQVDFGRRMQVVRLAVDDVARALLGGEDVVIEIAFLLESAGDGAGYGDAVGLGRLVVRLLFHRLVEVGHGQADRPAVQAVGPAAPRTAPAPRDRAGAVTSTGATPSTFGPANCTVALAPRLIASGSGVVAQGKSPIRNR